MCVVFRRFVILRHLYDAKGWERAGLLLTRCIILAPLLHIVYIWQHTKCIFITQG